MEEFNFEAIKNKALEQLKSGKSLSGKDGAFATLLENILNAALEGEMDAHLDEEERDSGNRRNVKMHKQVQTPFIEKIRWHSLLDNTLFGFLCGKNILFYRYY